MNDDAKKISKDWMKRLQENGYRTTGPRQAVVDIISSSQHILRPLDVYELARQFHPSIGLVTVYRTVEKLEELGLIQRVHQPSGCHAFIAATKGHQHLLICQECGRAEVFSGDRMEALIANVGQESGYMVYEHWLQLFGVCNDCQGKKSTGSDGKTGTGTG